MEALHEIQAAGFLGYRRISEFRRALRQGIVPKPDRYLQRGNRDPVWSRARLEAWLTGKDNAESDPDEILEAIRRARVGHSKS